MNKITKYYDANLEKLDEAHRFHYVYRRYFFMHEESFKDKLAELKPSTDLKALWDSLNPEDINSYDIRKPAFDKYPDVFYLEAVLFRVYYLLTAYQTDIRPEFEQLYPKYRLRALIGQIIADKPSFAMLSSYAVNLVWLYDELFREDKPDTAKFFADYLKTFKPSDFPNTKFYVYAITHATLCLTGYYQHEVEDKLALRPLYQRIYDNINMSDLTLDVKYELFLTTEMLGMKNTQIDAFRMGLKSEADAFLKHHKWLKDESRPDKYNTPNGSEHRNILFAMSSLAK